MLVRLSTDFSNLSQTDQPFVFLLIPDLGVVLGSNASFAPQLTTPTRCYLHQEPSLGFALIHQRPASLTSLPFQPLPLLFPHHLKVGYM